MPGQRFKAATVAVTLVAAIAGCGDSGDDTAADVPSGGGLATALGGVNTSDPDAEVAITWADTAALRSAADLPESATDALDAAGERWRMPLGYALGSPIGEQVGATDFGFDPLTGEKTIAIGVPPQRATLYAGVEAGDAKAAFEELGYEEDGELLARGDEGEVILDPSAQPTGSNLVGLNRVAIDGDRIAVGAFEDPVEAALGRSGEPVLDTGGVAASADCLGDDAIAAEVDDAEGRAAAEVALSAVGISAPSSDAVPEVICAIGKPGQSLGHVRDCMEGSFNGGGVDPATAQPYAKIIGEAEISEGELDGAAWVRATFEPSPKEPVGRVFSLALNGALAGPLGGDPLGFEGPAVSPEKLKGLRDELGDAC